MKKMYITAKMRRWKDLKMNPFGIEGGEELFQTVGPKGSPGFLIVFDSMEELKKSYPDAKPHEVIELSFAGDVRMMSASEEE